MDTMEHKGYRGAVHFSADDRVFHGRILGIDDVVSFEGATVDELERAFHEAVDDYLALCDKLGRAPDREYSGKIPLRIEADLHRRVAIVADSEAKSVNGWIADTLEAVVEKGWAVKKAGAKRATSRHRTQKDAVHAAKRMVSFGRDGKTRSSDTVKGQQGSIRDSYTSQPERGPSKSSSKKAASNRVATRRVRRS